MHPLLFAKDGLPTNAELARLIAWPAVECIGCGAEPRHLRYTDQPAPIVGP